VEALKPKTGTGDLRISFIGAGSFAQNSLIPNIKEGSLVSVATAESHNGRSVATKFGFRNALPSGSEVAAESESNVLFIATRHDSHFRYVMEGLGNRKHIFVEKPLCMTPGELEQVKEACEKAGTHLMVGFNRRFSPHIQTIKSMLNPGRPVAINYRINAGYIPPDHWTQDPQFGGGRIIGEVCHFIDLVIHLTGTLPTGVHAFAMRAPHDLNDTVTITLSFSNGSIATIQYLANGTKELEKEYLEVFSSGSVMIVDDFRTLTIIGKKKNRSKLLNQDKGHKEEVRSFLNAIKTGSGSPIPFHEIYAGTYTTFMVLNSLRENRAIDLSF
jgi:polar amino acid transport system substrate-binding protein